MSCSRTLLVGGLSAVHDPLLLAALESTEIAAAQLHPRTDAGLRRARALGNHGQCNPAHYAVGAVLEHAIASGDASFADRHAWLTLGSCGPCRLASFGIEWAQVLERAGLARLPVLRCGDLDLARASDALLAALVTGDVLSAAGRRVRPHAIAPDAVDRWLERSVEALAGALRTHRSIPEALRATAVELGGIERDDRHSSPHVLIVGEPWTTLDDGDPNYDLVRRLGIAGAVVEAPFASDWLRYRAHGEGGSAKLDRRIRAFRRLFGRELGLAPTHANEMDELAELARPHYDPAVLGGSAHLEIGRALRAKRDGSAELVISIKPFGCLPSSHLSDGILAVLARDGKTPPFLAIETTGTADAAVESRVEMALHAARLAVTARSGGSRLAAEPPS